MTPTIPTPSSPADQADHSSKMDVELSTGESFSSETCAYTVLVADVLALMQPLAQTAGGSVVSMAYAPAAAASVSGKKRQLPSQVPASPTKRSRVKAPRHSDESGGSLMDNSTAPLPIDGK